jgi:hypothetical protein
MEIERTLRKHGATSFMYATHEDTAIVGFILRGRQIRFALRLPDPTDRRFHFTEARKQRRTEQAAYAAWEAECRRSWRALNLVIKAKLEAIADGIVEFEQEFLAHLVGPGGQTVYEQIAPRLAVMLDQGTPQDLLPLALTERGEGP